MTRITVVPTLELDGRHVRSEKHEITRVFNLVRKAQARGINKYNKQEKLKSPDDYVLGTGHVKFFYDKLEYVVKRYQDLCKEGRRRGYNINEIPRSSLLSGIHKHWVGDYTPTENAFKLSRQRLAERLKEMA